MKKLSCAIMLLTLVYAFAAAQQSMTDVVADAVSSYLSPLGGGGQSGEKLLVLHFKAPTAALNDWAVDRFTEGFKSRGSAPVERHNRSAAANAASGKFAAEISDADAAAIGAGLGVRTVFTGVFTPAGKNWTLNMHAVNVASKKSVWSKKFTITPGETFQRLAAAADTPAPVASAAPSAPAKAPPPAAKPAAPSAPAPAASTSKTYQIGDTGPAGGIVFFDKWNNSDGWRYLEAAPVDVDLKLFAGIQDLNYSECHNRAVGAGKQNTQIIINKGGFGLAAQACTALQINGFADWFLPSRDELHYMYENLKQKSLGNFRNEQYWSSTSEGSHYFRHENFSNGSVDYDSGFSHQFRVRAIRQF
jgi:hypothetical protein